MLETERHVLLIAERVIFRYFLQPYRLDSLRVVGK